MEVIVLPAHRVLQHLVQLGQGRLGADMYAPPDQRLDGIEGDLELMNAHDGILTVRRQREPPSDIVGP